MKSILFTVITSLVLYGCATFPYQKQKSPKGIFQKELKVLIEDSLLSNAHIGLYIESLSNNEILFKQNESKLFLPASNQKLFTSAAVLEKLGADYQFKTEIYSSGEIVDSVLNGNLFIRGMGDPSISGKYYNGDILAIFNNWADSLIDKKIKKVKGNLIGLDGYFTDYKLGKGWNWDDETFWYSAQISALSFNNNCVDIKLIAGEFSGDSVQIIINPQSDYSRINYNLTTLPSDSTSKIDYIRTRAQNKIEITGGLCVGDTIEKSITIEKPALWFVTILRDVLQKHGILIEGEVLTGNMPFYQIESFVKKQFTHLSVPLKDLIKEVNTTSQNFYAEQIFKTLSAEFNQNGNAEESSIILMDWLKEIGVDETLAFTVDGSGLSRMNLVSPIATATVLKYMYKSPNYVHFYNSLPIAGLEGTLKNRMNNSIAQGFLRAKTGFLTHVRSLSGYTSDKDGNDYVFVIMVNNYTVPTSYINELQDKIAILLTGYNPN